MLSSVATDSARVALSTAAAAAVAPATITSTVSAAGALPIALATWRLHGQLLELRLHLLGDCLGGYKL